MTVNNLKGKTVLVCYGCCHLKVFLRGTIPFFLLFWSWLWGPAGALLSVPITAAIKIVCDNIAPLSPIGVLLGSGRAVREA